MVSTKVTSALLGAVYATTAAAFATSSDMGAAGIMWPEDRPWSEKHDNSSPCGSDASVGERTPFPLKNGKLALVTQDDARSVHISVSYENDPKTQDDFETFFGPNEVGSLGLGHTCITVPDVPEGVKAGDNATFSMLYVGNFADDESKRETFYACSDVVFVEVEAFDEAIPCFNTTMEDPEIKVDDSVSVTTTDSEGKQPHSISDFTTDSSSSKSMGAGEIAGAVVGSVAGLALIGAAAFFIRRRSQKKAAQKEQEQMREVEKANSDTLSTRS